LWEIPNKKNRVQIHCGKNQGKQRVQTCGRTQDKKKSTKGNIKMMNAIGWNIKQLDEKCPESLYVDERERERERARVCEVECN
jgi:hypothetical protein